MKRPSPRSDGSRSHRSRPSGSRPNGSRSAAPRRLRAFRSARELACHVLVNPDQVDQFAPQRLDEELRNSQLPDSERRLATELVYGTLRRQNTLDAILRKQIHRPWNQVEPLLQAVLRLGAYQLLMLDKIPVHAAVHESVELCPTFGYSAAKGFVNGVLRSVSRLITTEQATAPSTQSFPLDQAEYRQLKDEIFPDPQTQPAFYFELAFSFPAWLADRWSKRFAGEQLWQLGFALNTPAPLVLRVNRLRRTAEAYAQLLHAAEIEFHPGAFPETLRLSKPISPTQLPGWEEGEITVQDETAQRAARLLDPKSGERIWDVCAAPGGKTTHLAELMGDKGSILATDPDAERLRQVESACQRLQLHSVQVLPIQNMGEIAGEFDAALVDVPCSNTGVLGKRPDARWRITEKDLIDSPRVQQEIPPAHISAHQTRRASRLFHLQH
ncbi:MAG: transcription antitermination factor NusB [Planctomycetales bacterium]